MPERMIDGSTMVNEITTDCCEVDDSADMANPMPTVQRLKVEMTKIKEKKFPWNAMSNHSTQIKKSANP